jgi:sugar lactone lactonase YvrE
MKTAIEALVLSLPWLSAAEGQQYVISTVAGGAPPPTPIAGVQASIGQPQGVAVDSAGNVYFTGLNCVFKVDSKGVMTRVAGNSRAGYSGDGGPATSAQLFAPNGLAVDASGNLFIEIGRASCRERV